MNDIKILTDISLACPKCLKIVEYISRNCCSDDGTELIEFCPLCECGEYIDPWESYGCNYNLHFRWRFPKFWYFRYDPEPLHIHCERCGRPTKKAFDKYVKEWWMKTHILRESNEVLKRGNS